MPGQHFRAGVVIVVRHPLPQGGLHAGEEPIEGAWRELHEETGLTDQQVAARAEYPEWVAYEWPAEVMREHGREGKRRGQVQRWFLFDALDEAVEPTPDGHEFVAWRWVPPAWLIDHVLDWRRGAYERVLNSLS